MGFLMGFLMSSILCRSSLLREQEREYDQQDWDCYQEDPVKDYEIPTWAYIGIKDEPSDLYDRNDELYLKQKQEQDMRNNKQ